MVADALKSVENTSIEEPISHAEAMNSKNNNNYIKAMRKEMDSLTRKQTQTLVSNPKNKKVINCKWILKKEEGSLGVKDSWF